MAGRRHTATHGAHAAPETRARATAVRGKGGAYNAPDGLGSAMKRHRVAAQGQLGAFVSPSGSTFFSRTDVRAPRPVDSASERGVWEG